MADNQQFGQGDGVKLRDHLEQRMNDQLRYVESRIADMEKATRVATSALETRLAGMNEFRDALKDQAGRMVTRDELVIQVSKLTAEISELKQFRATQEGKASQGSVNTALLLSLAGLILGAVGLVMSIAGG